MAHCIHSPKSETVQTAPCAVPYNYLHIGLRFSTVMSIMQSAILKRSIVVRGHKTSVSLEDEFWHALKDIASQRRMTTTELITEVDTNRQSGNLSSTLRLLVLSHYREQA